MFWNLHIFVNNNFLIFYRSSDCRSEDNRMKNNEDDHEEKKPLLLCEDHEKNNEDDHEKKKPLVLLLLKEENKENFGSFNNSHIIQGPENGGLQHFLKLFLNLPESMKPCVLKEITDIVQNAARSAENVCDINMQEYNFDTQSDEFYTSEDMTQIQYTTWSENETNADSQFLNSFNWISDVFPTFLH